MNYKETAETPPECNRLEGNVHFVDALGDVVVLFTPFTDREIYGNGYFITVLQVGSWPQDQ